MIIKNAKENSLAVYKNKPAIIKEITNDKIIIRLPGNAEIKVREKDIELIHPGPAENFLFTGENGASDTQETGLPRQVWELLLSDANAISLKELAELVFGEYSPASAWAAYKLLDDSLYFTGTIDAITPRQREQVETEERKRGEKQLAEAERELFLERLKTRRPDLTSDSRFMQDIEALAWGKSEKSRTMKEIGLAETQEDAHALLLECGYWTAETNPYPSRFGISLTPARQLLSLPQGNLLPPESRRDLTGIVSYAIDSPWSDDPDDAVSLETEGGLQILYVHVSDPAALIDADSPAEREARDRGATLYIPEGSFRMLPDAFLPLFALGYSETSAALTFKITLDPNGEIRETDIFPSVVRVLRLTYNDADALIATSHNAEGAMLRDLAFLANRNLKRRLSNGAIAIDLPETRISLENGKVTIEPVMRHLSADIIRECMLLAGEAAGSWAAKRTIPLPCVEQEAGEIPGDLPDGIAGAWQLRRCMRPRSLSVKPGRHRGLGLDTYSQVTSPLRRYTDLLAHIQIRSYLQGKNLLDSDEVSARMNAGESAAVAVTQAERASRSHWTMIYLADKKDSAWDAIVLERKGNRTAVIIPAIGLETQAPVRRDVAANDTLRLTVKSVNIPWLEAVFLAEER